MYRTLTCASNIYSVKSSAILFVSVVIRTRCPSSAQFLHSAITSSTWLFVGRTMQTGSISPVGLTSCSVNTPAVFSNSQGPGVAETKIVWGRITSHSSNFNGRLSKQEGSRKPYCERVDFLAKSPLYIAPICGTVTWLSSTIKRAFSGKYSKRVGGA